MDLIQGDSRTELTKFEDESFDLILTSPPYPLIKKWDDLFGVPVDNGRAAWQLQHQELEKVWAQCIRLIRPGCIIVVNIGDATRRINNEFAYWPNGMKVTEYMMKHDMTPLIPVIWRKITNRPNAFLGSGFLPPNLYISQDCEWILIFRKGGVRKFPPKDPNRKKAEITKEQRDLWCTQVWDIPGFPGSSKTSEWPSEVPNRLIKLFSVYGDKVLDPYAGTCKAGVAAEYYGRQFTGIDIDIQEIKPL